MLDNGGGELAHRAAKRLDRLVGQPVELNGGSEVAPYDCRCVGVWVTAKGAQGVSEEFV